ncbi:hypothetical protein EON68_01090 [archaeon]|nr:MAG: hypothetical protein EON68_01090 [archaeon]
MFRQDGVYRPGMLLSIDSAMFRAAQCIAAAMGADFLDDADSRKLSEQEAEVHAAEARLQLAREEDATASGVSADGVVRLRSDRVRTAEAQLINLREALRKQRSRLMRRARRSMRETVGRVTLTKDVSDFNERVRAAAKPVYRPEKYSTYPHARVYTWCVAPPCVLPAARLALQRPRSCNAASARTTTRRRCCLTRTVGTWCAHAAGA